MNKEPSKELDKLFSDDSSSAASTQAPITNELADLILVVARLTEKLSSVEKNVSKLQIENKRLNDELVGLASRSVTAVTPAPATDPPSGYVTTRAISTSLLESQRQARPPSYSSNDGESDDGFHVPVRHIRKARKQQKQANRVNAAKPVCEQTVKSSITNGNNGLRAASPSPNHKTSEIVRENAYGTVSHDSK